MSNMSEDIQYAGSDTRPPMLDRTDFESWQQRIRLYCLGKDNGENIMKSITEGPFQMGMVIQTVAEETEGALQLGPERARVFTDLTAEEKERYKADIRATNILLQGIPKDIYTLINHYTDAKDIWDNVKMILEGSELTKDDRESQLYDEFERFLQIKGETIHVYYVRFTKLINDMRNIKMTMSRMQLNSKFVNNMLPEWSRFITEVKLNRGLKESNFDQLYAYLKQHEVHANENRMMMERFIQPTNDPLDLVFNALIQYSSTKNLIESLTNSLSLLTQSYKSNLPQTNNHLRTSSNARKKATVQDGRVVVQDVRGGQNRVGNVNPGQAKPIKCYNCNGLRHIAQEYPWPKRPQDSNYFKDKMLLMQAQENGAVLDEEQLAVVVFYSENMVTNVWITMWMIGTQCGPYVFEDDLMASEPVDSDVDEASYSPHSLAHRRVQDHDTFVDHMDEYHEVHEMQSDVQHNFVVDFDADYTSDSNIILSYVQYEEEKTKLMCVQSSVANTQIEDLKTQLEGNLKVATRSSVKTKVLVPGISVNATPTVKIVLNKGKQIWKPKGKLSDNSLNKTKQIWQPKGKQFDKQFEEDQQVWKATGKLFANVGYQWRPTGKKFTLGKLNCGYQWRPTGKKFALGENCAFKIGISVVSGHPLVSGLRLFKYMMGNRSKLKILLEKFIGLTSIRYGHISSKSVPENSSNKYGVVKSEIIHLWMSTSMKGYRIYNKRTRRLMETIHVTFDEMHQTMAPVRISLGPEPFMMTPGQLNSGLAPSPIVTGNYQNISPTVKDLEIFFQSMSR
ncbi:hypothetical protein Tco_0721893 [Tanacetum coccineum]